MNSILLTVLLVAVSGVSVSCRNYESERRIYQAEKETKGLAFGLIVYVSQNDIEGVTVVDLYKTPVNNEGNVPIWWSDSGMKVDPWGGKYLSRITPKNVVVWSNGPDGKEYDGHGENDDIVAVLE